MMTTSYNYQSEMTQTDNTSANDMVVTKHLYDISPYYDQMANPVYPVVYPVPSILPPDRKYYRSKYTPVKPCNKRYAPLYSYNYFAYPPNNF
jgi:hypothetical protein